MKYDICVFGGCSLDQMFYQDDSGKYPEMPNESIPGGKASNQAVAAAKAGAKVAIISKLGNDFIGNYIIENLRKYNIDTSCVEMVDGLNNDCSKIYINNQNKDNEIVRHDGAIKSFTKDMIEKYSSIILDSKIIIAQMKAPKEVCEELINFCYKNNKKLIITPCRPEKLVIGEEGNLESIKKISIITANRSECEKIFNTSDIKKCVEMYPNKLIVTLGNEGVVYHNGIEIVKIPACKVENIEDTTGAGDTFNGNLAVSIINKYTLKNAIIRAQYASAMKLQKKTAQAGMPTKDELDEYILEYNNESNNYKEELITAYKLILKAYNLINTDLQITVDIKNDKSFVTSSDIYIEKILINGIKDKFNKDNFVTEETYSNNTIKDRTWIIDPIDGTAHYMKQSLFWGIQLAFIDKGKTQFSIIYLPKIHELYYAIKDTGVYLNNIKVDNIRENHTEMSIIEFTGSINKFTKEKENILLNIKEKNIQIMGYLHINSCCFAFSNLISGRSDLLVSSVKRLWDILPGELMCKELGIDTFENNNLKLYSKNTKLIKEII